MGRRGGKMDKLFKNGRTVRMASIDRGPLLFYSEEEWKRRFNYETSMSSLLWMMVVLIGFLVSINTHEDLIFVMPMFIAGFLTFYITYYLAAGRHLKAGRALPGLASAARSPAANRIPSSRWRRNAAFWNVWA